MKITNKDFKHTYTAFLNMYVNNTKFVNQN